MAHFNSPKPNWNIGLNGCFLAFFASIFSSAGILQADGRLTIYSGRTKALVDPLIAKFETETKIDVDVRYGGTAELAATILEEGSGSPADVFYAQDAGALGALADRDRLADLPESVLTRVDRKFRSADGFWVGTSGRARVVVYNTDRLAPEDLPNSILGFTDPRWSGRLGWAPLNGSFQAAVTALTLQLGEEKTADWLKGILANKPRDYPSNSAIVAAVGAGEIDVGFANHYYLFRFLSEQGEAFPAANYYPGPGDPGALMSVSGVGIVEGTKNREAALKFVEYLLSLEAQQFFADQTYEYPMIDGVKVHPKLKPLTEIESPELDLARLADLDATLTLLRETGVLE
jgi:iron(III) transport system substrate-binding protein